jgi:hypothetical protein
MASGTFEADNANVDWLGVAMAASVEQEFRARLRKFTSGTSTLAALWDWLRWHVQELADSDDPAVRQLEGELALLIAEHDIGQRDEASIRAAIAASSDGTRSGAPTEHARIGRNGHPAVAAGVTQGIKQPGG